MRRSLPGRLLTALLALGAPLIFSSARGDVEALATSAEAEACSGIIFETTGNRNRQFHGSKCMS